LCNKLKVENLETEIWRQEAEVLYVKLLVEKKQSGKNEKLIMK